MQDLIKELLAASVSERTKILAREFGTNEELKAEALARLAIQENSARRRASPSPGMPVLGLPADLPASGSNRMDAPGTWGSGNGFPAEKSGPGSADQWDREGGRRSPQIPFVSDRYELKSLIGFGGMGAVWSAEQKVPVRRAVAIKLIKRFGASEQVIRRFEAERQALAIMDHPHIARIFDGGTTDSGEPYFVMELVDGIPLTEFCDKHQLTVRNRLELFGKVCQGVQHAHQKGILHRDLKPGNILVAMIDGVPVPKVIDFGVAKAVDQKLTDESLHETGAIVGTPTYMSPEQADPHAPDIDTRTDIYSLGVILYELLVGMPPLDAQDFKRAAVLEMLRMVREVDPPRPSTRLSSADNLPSIAASRAIEPGELMRWVRGDIDWIVMKALEKDRDRRYDSPNELAADIQRFLTHEPVVARPPSRSYRVRKFIRKYRGTVLATSLILFALLAGLVGTAWGLFEANKQRILANQAAARESVRAESERQARMDAQKSANAERIANELTSKRLVQIERNNKIITSIFDDFDIRKSRNDSEPLEAVLASRLVAAGKQLDEDRVGDPLVVAALQHELANSLLSLGFPEESLPLFEKARAARTSQLGATDRETLATLVNLAEALDMSGQSQKALTLKQEAFDQLKKLQGAEHPDTLMAQSNLAVGLSRNGQYAEALALFESILEARKRVLGPDHFDTLSSMNNLAQGYTEVGDLARALTVQKETYDLMKATLGDDNPDTLLALLNLAAGYRSTGEIRKALPLMDNAYKRTVARLGSDHPTTLLAMSNLGATLWSLGQRERGLPLIEDGYRLSRDKLGARNPATLSRMGVMVTVLSDLGKTDVAIPLGEECLKLTTEVLGPDHPDTLNIISALGECYGAVGQFDKALPLLQDLLDRRTKILGRDHPSTLTAINQLGGVYLAVGPIDRALELFQESLLLKQKKYGDDHPETRADQGNLAVIYRQIGRLDLALPLMQQVVDSLKSTMGDNHPNTVAAQFNMSAILVADGKIDAALKAFAEFRAGFKSQSINNRAQYASLLTIFSRRLFMAGEFLSAEDFLREAQEISESLEPDAWSTFAVQALLGRVLLIKKEYDEADFLLVSGYAGMKSCFDTIPPDDRSLLIETLDQLIVLCEATENPEGVEKWREERKQWPTATTDPDSQSPPKTK